MDEQAAGTRRFATAAFREPSIPRPGRFLPLPLPSGTARRDRRRLCNSPRSTAKRPRPLLRQSGGDSEGQKASGDDRREAQYRGRAARSSRPADGIALRIPSARQPPTLPIDAMRCTGSPRDTGCVFRSSAQVCPAAARRPGSRVLPCEAGFPGRSVRSQRGSANGRRPCRARTSKARRRVP